MTQTTDRPAPRATPPTPDPQDQVPSGRPSAVTPSRARSRSCSAIFIAVPFLAVAAADPGRLGRLAGLDRRR